MIPQGKSRKLHNPWTGPFRVEEILVSTTPLKHSPVIGSGMKLLDSSGNVTDDETENSHEELPAIEDEPETETVQPTAGCEEALHRYPLRIRRVPDRYGTHAQH
ncbi:hypothetical protein EMCRGX_G000498 [Ephydatia muelleri]